MRTSVRAPSQESTVVQPPGDELDIAVVPELRSSLAGASRPGARVVLDMRGVTFLDSSALSVVLAADQRLAASDGELRLANVAPEVRRVLRICGLARLVLPDAREGLLTRLSRA